MSTPLNGHPVFGQSDSIYRLPAGTRISLEVDAEVNSRVSSVNDTFLATVAKPVVVRDAVKEVYVQLQGRDVLFFDFFEHVLGPCLG